MFHTHTKKKDKKGKKKNPKRINLVYLFTSRGNLGPGRAPGSRGKIRDGKKPRIERRGRKSWGEGEGREEKGEKRGGKKEGKREGKWGKGGNSSQG